MSFTIKEARPGRPEEVDPYLELETILLDTEIGQSKTVPIEAGDSELTRDEIGKGALWALSRYAAQQGVTIGNPRHELTGNSEVTIYFTKRNKIVRRKGGAEQGIAPPPDKKSKKAASAGGTD